MTAAQPGLLPSSILSPRSQPTEEAFSRKEHATSEGNIPSLTGLVYRDEHSLIAQYCHKLHNGDFTSVVPDSPMQMMEILNRDQTQELELMIRELESENANLQEEYQHLKASSSSSTSGTSGLSSGSGNPGQNQSKSRQGKVARRRGK